PKGLSTVFLHIFRCQPDDPSEIFYSLRNEWNRENGTPKTALLNDGSKPAKVRVTSQATPPACHRTTAFFPRETFSPPGLRHKHPAINRSQSFSRCCAATAGAALPAQRPRRTLPFSAAPAQTDPRSKAPHRCSNRVNHSPPPQRRPPARRATPIIRHAPFRKEQFVGPSYASARTRTS